MENNFTKYAYTESVKKMQSAFGVREFNETLGFAVWSKI
jgi:hypothetical protein